MTLSEILENGTLENYINTIKDIRFSCIIIFVALAIIAAAGVVTRAFITSREISNETILCILGLIIIITVGICTGTWKTTQDKIDKLTLDDSDYKNCKIKTQDDSFEGELARIKRAFKESDGLFKTIEYDFYVNRDGLIIATVDSTGNLEFNYDVLDKIRGNNRIEKYNNADVEEIKEKDTKAVTEESLTEEEIIEKINNREVDVHEGKIVYEKKEDNKEKEIETEDKVEETTEETPESITEEIPSGSVEEVTIIDEPNTVESASEEPLQNVEEPVSEPVVAPAGGIFTDSLTDGTAANVIIDEGVTDAQKIEFFTQYNLIPYAMRKDLMDMGQPIHLTTSPAMTEGHAGTAYAMYECYIYVGKKNAIKIATIHEFGHLIDALIANRTGYQESGAFYSENARFVDIYNRERAQSGFPSYASDCVEDYFAEAFMYYHQNRSKLDNVPETKQYIHDLILAWYGIEY